MLDENDWLEEVDELDVDYNNLRRKHVKGGYREGVTDGQEYSLQSSFNAGFMKIASYHEKLSTYRGCLSAIMMFLSTDERCPESTVQKLEEAILKLEKLEDNEVHVDSLLEDRETFIQLNSKLCNLDGIERNEPAPVEVGMMDELSDAMNLSFKAVGTDVEAMEEEEVENGKCGGTRCECTENCLSKGGKENGHSRCKGNHISDENEQNCTQSNVVLNGNKNNLCRCNKRQHATVNINKAGDVNCCETGCVASEKNEKIFKETLVAIQEIVLDTLRHLEGSFSPLILKKIRDNFVE